MAEERKETESKYSGVMSRSRNRNQAPQMCTEGLAESAKGGTRTVLKSALDPNLPPTLAFHLLGCGGLRDVDTYQSCCIFPKVNSY